MPGPTGVPGESVRCNLRPIDVLVADAGCANSDVGGLKTACTTSFGDGHKYTVTQTKTVTTTPFSGAVPSGADSVATTVTGPTNVDNVCYPAPQAFNAQPPVDIAGCAAWPCTEVTVLPGGSENSLADVAQYYYKTDLRDTMTNDPLKGGVPPAGDRAGGRQGVASAHDDVQHRPRRVGYLNYRPDYRELTTVTGDFADIRTGAKNWPLWPDPLLDYSNPDNYNNPKSIDDFWHAAVDGRGRYFNGRNPSSVIQGVGAALAKIDDKLATGTADGTRPCSLSRATTSPTRRATSRVRGKATSRRGWWTSAPARPGRRSGPRAAGWTRARSRPATTARSCSSAAARRSFPSPGKRRCARAASLRAVS